MKEILLNLIIELKSFLNLNPISSTFLFLLPLILTFNLMSLFNNKKANFDPNGKHCYIGGGSEGLGLSLACQLAKKGAHISIISRTESKLILALAEIEKHRQSPTQIFKYYSCDLTSPTASASTLHEACKPHNSLAPSYIFACAGGSTPGLFLDQSVENHFEGLDWNFKTALCTIHEGMKKMKEDGVKGKVVLTSSILAMMGFAGYSSYSPGKYAIRGLADSLRNEMILYGISVHLFLPATIFTAGFERENLTKPALTKIIEGPDEGMTPDKVATALIKGLERNEYYITYEPVGNMLRNSRGIVPRNNLLLDTFWGIAGTIALPIWRILEADGAVHKEAKRLLKESK